MKKLGFVLLAIFLFSLSQNCEAAWFKFGKEKPPVVDTEEVKILETEKKPEAVAEFPVEITTKSGKTTIYYPALTLRGKIDNQAGVKTIKVNGNAVKYYPGNKYFSYYASLKAKTLQVGENTFKFEFRGDNEVLLGEKSVIINYIPQTGLNHSGPREVLLISVLLALGASFYLRRYRF